MLKTGLYFNKQDEILGIKITDETKNISNESIFTDSKDLSNLKNPVIGFPFDHFITKTVKLPKLTKEELKKTVELQIEFLLGEDAFSLYMINTKIVTQSTGSLLFIVAAKIPEEIKKLKKNVILPDSIALYSYGMKEKIIDIKKTIMLIYIGTEYTHLVVAAEQTIVFMRSFSSRSDINSEIKLSEQAVYLQPERCFVKIDEFVIYYNDESVKQKINFLNDSNIRWIDVSKYLINGKEYFLSVGLAFYEYSAKQISAWNIAKKPPTTVESLKRSMYWILPVLLLFLPLYYYGDYYNDQISIKILENEIQQINGQVANVDYLNRKVVDAQSTLEDYAGPCLEYAKFYNILVLINQFRPQNLWLTNISGKIDGEIVITGFSKDFSEISTLIKQMNTSDFIKTLNLNYSNAASAGKVNFQMTIDLTDSYDFIIDYYSKNKDKITVKNLESENIKLPASIDNNNSKNLTDNVQHPEQIKQDQGK